LATAARDQGHSYGQLMHLAWIAEVYWKQGVDVYSDLDNRLLADGEFFSRYNLDDGLTAGATYSYVVSATNAVGDSADSPPETVTLTVP
jgi:hypothetical protein